MKKIILLLLFLSIFKVNAQQNGILFQRLLGGSSQDGLNSYLLTPDGGFIIAGFTGSTDGDIQQAPLGDFDVSITKLNATGAVEWQKSYGGTSSDQNARVKATADGGYVISALSISDDGMLTGNYGTYDFWVFKIDSIGTLLWQKNFGGSDSDEPQQVMESSDGSIIVVGRTFSNDFDVTGNHGLADTWILKLDAAGNVIWKSVYGSSGGEMGFDVVETSDGNFVVYGSAGAADGEVSSIIGLADLWLFKINSTNGTIIWEHTYGGTNYEVPQKMIQTADGGFALSGQTFSSDFNFIGTNYGNGDAFILKADSTGVFQWAQTFGGSGSDLGKGLTQLSDGTFVYGISTQSNNGDMAGNHGSWDAWIINTDSSGAILWRRVIGGSDADLVEYVVDAGNNEFWIFGNTSSINGDVPAVLNHGSSEGWMLKMKPVNSVFGYVFADFNNNQIREVSEPLISNTLVTTSNVNGNYSSLTASNGVYVNYADTGTFLTEVLQSSIFNPVAGIPSTFSGYGEMDTAIFPLTLIPGITDGAVQILPMSPVRPGFKSAITIVYSNEGTDTISGVITLIKPSVLTLDSSGVLPSYINGDTIAYNYSALAIFETRSIYIRFTNAGPPAVNLGDTLQYTVTMTTNNLDVNRSDNFAWLDQVVIGSFDPNDKTCLQGDAITTTAVQDGQWLDYFIRFQNTGNDVAFNVMITDVLDASLDKSTLQLIKTSHTCSTSLIDNEVHFNFNNIMLPDSNSNEPASHGYVAYRVKVNQNASLGTVINNTADIYFDYNEAVTTNTTSTVIVVPAGIAEGTSLSLINAYPNPVSNQFYIEFELPERNPQFYLTDVTGRIISVNSLIISPTRFSFDVTHLESGLYHLMIVGENGKMISRIIKN